MWIGREGRRTRETPGGKRPKIWEKNIDTKVTYMGCCLHLIDVNVIMGVNEAKGIWRVIYKRGSNLFRERRVGKACKWYITLRNIVLKEWWSSIIIAWPQCFKLTPIVTPSPDEWRKWVNLGPLCFKDTNRVVFSFCISRMCFQLRLTGGGPHPSIQIESTY